MGFHSEIKEFTKNTLILTLFLTLTLHLSWGYIAPYLGLSSFAAPEISKNDQTFQQATTNYMGSIATALSLNVGNRTKPTEETPSNLASPIISISEVLASPDTSGKKLIASNMIHMQSYVNLMKTDIVEILARASDRRETLDEHIELLKSYYSQTRERSLILDEQSADLKAILANAESVTNTAKSEMQQQFEDYDYTSVDTVIASYVSAKNNENQARVYLTYLERFRKSYDVLQSKNRVLIDTLTNNRDALIKNTYVVIPNAGDTLVKELGLIKTEADTKANQ